MRAVARIEGGKFCRNGINCRDSLAGSVTKNPGFIGFFAMARRLLILVKVKGRYAAFVGVLSCCLLLAPCHRHWMPSTR
jgi:hypothetical protein